MAPSKKTTNREPFYHLSHKPDPSRWPTPLAYAIQEYQNHRQPTLMVWHMVDLIEIGLKMIATIAIGDLLDHGPLPAKVADSLAWNIEKPTLGSWISIAQILCDRKLANSPTIIPEWRSTLENNFLPFMAPGGRRDRGFGAIRNLIAHSFITTDSAVNILEEFQKPAEECILSLKWLRDYLLAVRTGQSSFGVFIGPNREPEPLSESRIADPSKAKELTQLGQEVILLSTEKTVSLWPFLIYDHSSGGGGEDGSGKTLQMYLRCHSASLMLAPFGEPDQLMTLSDNRAFNALQGYLPRIRKKYFRVRGFELEMRKEAQDLLGRSKEISRLCELFRNALKPDAPEAERILWVQGPTGIGKSYIVSWLVNELMNEQTAPGKILLPPGTRPDSNQIEYNDEFLVFPYRFQPGDPRCTVVQFFQYLYERLVQYSEKYNVGKSIEALAVDEQLTIVCRLIKEIGQGRKYKLIIVLDGVDEIIRSEPNLLINLKLPMVDHAVWILTGCTNLPPLHLGPDGFTNVYAPNELEMSAADVRSILLNRIPAPVRDQMLSMDTQDDSEAITTFIQRVIEASHGLPIYLTYLIEDLSKQRISPQEPDKLPPSLDRYHDQLVEGLDLSQKAFLRGALASTIAVAKEPLTVGALYELMFHRDLVDDRDSFEVVEKSIASLGSVVTSALTPEGEEGYTLFHDTFGQHLWNNTESSPLIEVARRTFSRLADNEKVIEPSLRRYIFRRGLKHLANQGQAETALSLLCRPEYLMDRLQMLPNGMGVRQISFDWDLFHASVEGEATVWEDFWRTREHLLLKGDLAWPSEKILLQTGWEHAQDSLISAAFEKWIEKQYWKVPWLHSKHSQRPSFRGSGYLYNVFSTRSPAWSVAISQDSRYAAAGDASGWVYCWITGGGGWMEERQVHHDKVNDLCFSLDGRYLIAGSPGNTLKVLDVSDQLNTVYLHEHQSSLRSFDFSPDRGLLASGDRSGLVIVSRIDAHLELSRFDFRGKTISRLKFDPEGRLLAVGFDNGEINILSLEEGTEKKIGRRHKGRITDLVWCSKGLVSTGMDNKTLLWEINDKGGVIVLKEHCNPLSKLSRLPVSETLVGIDLNRRLVAWPAQNLKPPEQIITENQVSGVSCLAALPNQEAIVCGDNSGAVRIWKLAPESDPVFLGTHGVPVLCVNINADNEFAITGGSGNKVCMWRLDAQATDRSVRGHQRKPSWVALLDGGSCVASCRDFGVWQELLLWNSEDGSCIGVLPEGYLWSPDGLVWDNNTLTALGYKIQDASLCLISGRVDELREEVLWPACGYPKWMGLSPDGLNCLAAYGDNFRTWTLSQQSESSSTDSGKEKDGNQEPERWLMNDLLPKNDRKSYTPLKALTWNWECSLFAYSTPLKDRERLTVRHIKNREQSAGFETEYRIKNLVLDNSGRRLAAISEDRNISVWDLPSKTVGEKLGPRWVNPIPEKCVSLDRISFDSEGRRLCALCSGPMLCSWNAETGYLISTWRDDNFKEVPTELYGLMCPERCGDDGVLFDSEKGLCFRLTNGEFVYWVAENATNHVYAGSPAVFTPQGQTWSLRLLELDNR